MSVPHTPFGSVAGLVATRGRAGRLKRSWTSVDVLGESAEMISATEKPVQNFPLIDSSTFWGGFPVRSAVTTIAGPAAGDSREASQRRVSL